MFQQHVHVLVVTNDEVDAATGQLNSNALPRIERQLSQLFMSHRVDVLPQHPEARVRTTVVEVGNIRHVTAAVAHHSLEVAVHFEELIEIKLFISVEALFALICDGLSVENEHCFGVIAKLNEHMVAHKVLEAFFKLVIEFEAGKPFAR